ncbi:cell division topological specificity factor MinE [Hathewaya limosa]|uniref:Cell division topological specificity factor n=1 Tax=Hathewaya limosa TaxID=1536 RepID=A0ABU0JQY9_HATLI|nr:cell division topological specificity factor MinE [Hathewaya limosa]AWZ48834.1 cell division topological specificity factor MinE [Clostridiaceae bacterium 14S0207]MDQ0479511.1 cell division topological specificity factor [Hathewaya limosa]
MDLLKIFSSKSNPKDTASNRLKLILIHDRASVSPELLDKIKTELLQVISKYVEIDTQELDVKVTRTEEIEGSSPALIASIPIKNIKE